MQKLITAVLLAFASPCVPVLGRSTEFQDSCMASLLSFLKRNHASPVVSPLLGSLVPLRAEKCDAHTCSATRTSVDVKSVGGSLHPLGVPEPKQRKRWKRALTVPLVPRYSLTASAWEDGSGQGSLTLESRRSSRRKRKHSHTSRLTLVGGNGSEDDSHVVQKDISFENKQIFVSPEPITWFMGDASPQGWTPQSVNWIERYVSVLLPKKSKSSKPVKNFRLALTQDSKGNNFSISKHDTRYGKFDLQFSPGKRVSTSMTLKDSLWKRRKRRAHKNAHDKARDTVPRRAHKETVKKRRSAHMLIKSDFEYRWKEDSFSVSNAIEAFHGVLSLRARSNPMRFTPRIQVPVGRRRKDPPWMSWAREPGSGFGEIQFGRKGLEVSADWPNPKFSLKQKSSDGSSARVSLSSKGVFSVHKSVISRPTRAGSVVTLNAHMANKKGGSGITATVTSPFGVLSASANTSRSFSLVAHVNLDKGDRAYTLALKTENANAIAARVGLFF